MQEQDGWSGFYLGTSFGYGFGNSKSKYHTVSRYRDEETSAQTDQYVDGADVVTELFTDTDIYNQTDDFAGHSKGSSWNEGALADLYLGASTHLAPRLIAGVQVEGALSAMPFDSNITNEKGTSTSSSSSDSLSTDSQGNVDKDSYWSKSTGKFTNRYNQQANLELDWMVSVIGRAGWLATPTTLLYGLGGWSYGHFNTEDVAYNVGLGLDDFNASGPTVGGGVEQKLSSKWSLRAEYRYTNFGKHSFSTTPHSVYKNANERTDGSTGSCCDTSDTEHSTSTQTYNNSSKGYFDNDMQVVRVGVTRYFLTGN